MSYILDDTELTIPVFSKICTYCKHLDTSKLRGCAAFDQIPMDIWLGKNDHTEPVEGDKGIRFEKRNDVK